MRLEFPAARSDHLTGDPLDGVANLAPAARSPRITDRMVPSIDEVFDLADAIATLGPVRDGRPLGEQYRSLVLVAGTLAPRPGELVAHRPEWIHLGNPTVVEFGATEAAVYDRATGLSGSRTRQLKHREPGEFRRVPALDDVTEALREHLERGHHSTERTWLSPHGGGHLNWANLRSTYWRPACERVFAGSSKPDLARMPPKMLRKAAITFWLDAGISPYLASEWAGHSEDVARRYHAGRASDSYAAEISKLTERRG
ncbi:hypothetical protein [Microbacterium sp.]|uniref:hypothetical protein n=1 Tax=Microbacterium sp. TaxID=51671 RepID=UPI002735061E|nr:hypothetical protein [Microbacterium sp.]MDP3953169.1 hypothetical protein [Microbacterium sp.]